MRISFRDALVATPFVVAGQLAAFGVVADGGELFHGSHGVNSVIAGVFDGLLLFRRRAPRAALAVMPLVGIVQTVYAGSTGFFGGFIPLLLLVFSVALRESKLRSIAATAYALAGLIAIVLIAPGLSLANELPFSGTLLVLIWALGRYLRTREHRTVSAEARAADLEATREAVLEDERARIARELHDVIAHSVSVMVVQAGAARMLLDDDIASARGSLLAVERSGRHALEEMRRLLGILRQDQRETELVPQPGLDAVQALVEQVRSAGLEVGLDVEGEPQPLAPGADLSAYRILQEALTNTIKHAGAASAAVRVAYSANEVELEVTDDGCGPSRGTGGGHGLVGMQERVDLYGGRLDTGANPGGGYRVRAWLPLEAG
jgi:signal transduction histidine kinase